MQTGSWFSESRKAGEAETFRPLCAWGAWGSAPSWWCFWSGGFRGRIGVDPSLEDVRKPIMSGLHRASGASSRSLEEEWNKHRREAPKLIFFSRSPSICRASTAASQTSKSSSPRAATSRSTGTYAPRAPNALSCAGYLEYPFQNKQELCSISQAVPGISPGKERKREIRLMETTRFLIGCSK
jgi:hypothetical protein